MDILYSDAINIHKPAFGILAKPAGASCNLNCTYCYYLEKQKLYPGKSNPKMPDEVLEVFIKDYISAQDVPVVTFTWQGGEPTLMGIGFFKKAIELQKKYSRGRTIENSLQTNGTLLTSDWCKFFKDNNILVGISIDGEEHVHDHYRQTFSGGSTFRKVMESINLLHKYGTDFNTLSTVNDYSLNYALDTYRFLKKCGSGYMQFLPVVERISQSHDPGALTLTAPVHGDALLAPWSVPAAGYGRFLVSIFDEWVRNDVAKYYIQIFDATLANHAGEDPGLCVFNDVCGDALAMEHNGDLFSCDHFVYPEYMLGNILSSPLKEIVKSGRQLEFGISKRNSLPGYCLKCRFRYACHGECPKHRFINTPEGEPGLNYLCDGLKMFFSHAEPYMKFMARELSNKRPPANVMKWVNDSEKRE